MEQETQSSLPDADAVIREKLALSLTAETTELLPYLPYLLQDFWELGCDPDIMAELVRKHIGISKETRILDLACGKGAVSVKLAAKLRVRVTGIDLMPEFIEFARQKAGEYGVKDLCEFRVGDINEAMLSERDYDCVILGGVGSVLGDPQNPAETLNKLKQTLKPGGYIFMDEGYIPDGSKIDDIKHNTGAQLYKKDWMDAFEAAGLELTETVTEQGDNNLDKDTGLAAITARANELIKKHPDKKGMFEDYIKAQQNEYDDLDNSLVCVTWALRKPASGAKAVNIAAGFAGVIADIAGEFISDTIEEVIDG